MLEWVAYLEYLQSILLDYDPMRAHLEPMMVKYFQEGLWPSILAEVHHDNLEVESFVQIVRKAVVAEVKANLQFRASVQDMDQHCIQGLRLVHIIVAKSSTQSQLMNDSREKESKARGFELLITQ